MALDMPSPARDEHAAWDAIAGPDRPLAQSRFVSCVERGGVEGARFRRLVLCEENRPALAAEITRLDVRLDLLSPTPFRGAVARARQLWLRLLRLPVLFAGLPASFAQPGVRFGPGLSRSTHQRLVNGLVAEMEAQAETWDCPLLCLKEFTTDEADALSGPLTARGFLRLPSLPGVRLPLSQTFDAHRARMRSGYRRQLDADLAALRTLRLRRLTDWRGESDTLYGLYSRVMDRAPYQLERFGPEFFHALAEADELDTAALVLDDPHNPTSGPLANAIIVYGSETAVFLLAGIDYGRAEQHRAYPALVAAVVRDAIGRRCRALELGQTSYELKMRVGGVPTDRWLFLKARSRMGHRVLRALAPTLFPPWDLPPRRVFRQGP